jgi:o-succinylbenzoate synthase
MKAKWTKRTLRFKRPTGTSRGVLITRDVWYITLSENGKNSIGECAPLPRLSVDAFDQIDCKLDEICAAPNYFINDLSLLANFPSIRFGLEMALLDLNNGGGQIYFSPIKSIKINGLIWMGDPDFMMNQLEHKLAEGWQCIKIKIGALDFDEEIKILKYIRSRFSKNDLELRVDANGAFTKNDVEEKLNRLSEFELHSIEQPLEAGQWEFMANLCQISPIPIALDEELVPLIDDSKRIKMLQKVNPQYLVLKPSLLGGFSESEKWIKLAKKQNINWWITSALESNIGLNAIAQWTQKIDPKGYQGLGTGKLFTNNIPSSLNVKYGKLSADASPVWNEVNLCISDWFSPNDEMILQTSGSTGKPVSISVRKEWMKNSAQLTGKTFGLNEGDSGLLCIPIKYVAGKMMVVRSLELGLDLNVVEPSSSPFDGVNNMIDFAAVVPLQLENSLDQLIKVKTLIVGGGQVSHKLVAKLQSAKTEVFETYGMTETLTHVAIKQLNGPNKSDVFKALDGVSFEKDERGCLVIHANKLIPKSIITNDLVDLINETFFRWLGRFDNIINSGGVKIIPEVVEAKLASSILGRRYFITGISDESLGDKMILIVEGDVIDISFDSLEKYEKLKEIYFISKFEETESGKVNRIETLKIKKLYVPIHRGA